MNAPQRPRTPYFDWSIHPMPHGQPPAWAAEYGEDDYGPWASLAVPTDDPYRPVVQKFRWIPPGGFWMGSPEDEAGRFGNEGPKHWVTVTNGFWLGDAPVTQGMWTAIMGSNPSHFATGESDYMAQRPVENVSFDDIQRFLETLNKASNEIGWRLPTETEWEYGCRAGGSGELPLTGTSEGEWGPTLNPTSVSWFTNNSGGTTQPVGQLKRNALGLSDALGNVWEWCDSVRNPYEPLDRFYDPSFPQRTDPSDRAFRVLRGGSWRSGARGVRAAFRNAERPDFAWIINGFRLARGQG